MLTMSTALASGCAVFGLCRCHTFPKLASKVNEIRMGTWKSKGQNLECTRPKPEKEEAKRGSWWENLWGNKNPNGQ